MRHIREFDGLRGLLALWVYVAHAIESGPFWAATRHVHANGAVDVFIILSGFVIFYLLSRGEDYRTFITRRWFRLFPVFAACFLIALVLYASLGIQDELAFGIAGQDVKPHLIAHATMLHGVVPEEVLPHSARAILPPAWSISVEWQFYLIAPLLFLLMTGRSWKALGIVVALVALRVLHDIGRLGSIIPGLPETATFGMEAFLPLKLEFFAVGAACCWLWLRLSLQEESRIPPWCILILLVGIGVAGPLRPAIAVWLAVFAIVLWANFGEPRAAAGAGQATALFQCRGAQFLGRISYPLYLLHLPVIVVMREFIHAIMPGLSPFAFQSVLMLTSLPISIAGAWTLHRFLEQPMIDLGKRVTRRANTSQPADAAAGASSEQEKSAACGGALVH
jgi:peptidoglycan/LPS O-acetylase OafA/YrhL